MASSRNIPCQANECAAWFAGRVPDDWFEGPIEVRVDRDEIVVIGTLPAPSNVPSGDSVPGAPDSETPSTSTSASTAEVGVASGETSDSAAADETGSETEETSDLSDESSEMDQVAAAARIGGFREDSRLARMKIAEAGQTRWQRHVSWGVRCGDYEMTFTNASVPVMTRLRFDDRQILDTLIDAGVARSRSEAMAWCVSQVGQNQGEWIDRLRNAMSEVERIRADGP